MPNEIFKVETGVQLSSFAKSQTLFSSNNKSSHEYSKDTLTIAKALGTVLRQLQLSGRRERTLHDYQKWTEHYCITTGNTLLAEITVDSIYYWLSSMGDISNTTKNIRLKSFKAVLSRFHENGWLPVKFWSNIVIKVDKKVKPAATDSDVTLLLSMLDLSDWFQLRDACAILLMYRCGLRTATVSKLREEHLDFQNGYLNLTGDIMKNHDTLKLPIDTNLIQLLEALITVNHRIKQSRHENNTLVFVTKQGTCCQTAFNNNVLQKRIGKYSNQLELGNVSPHALRRGFATNLMKQGAPVSLIQHALGHADLSTTTQYLYLSQEDTAAQLKQYL